MKGIALPTPDELGVYRYPFGAKIWRSMGDHGLPKWVASWSSGVILADEHDRVSYFDSPEEAHECISRDDPALETPPGESKRGLRAMLRGLFSKFSDDLGRAMGREEAGVSVALEDLWLELSRVETPGEREERG